MSDTTVFATLGAIGFGFITWYWWSRQPSPSPSSPSSSSPSSSSSASPKPVLRSLSKTVETVHKSRSRATLSRETSETTVVSQVIETRQTVKQIVLKDEEKVERSTVHMVTETEATAISPPPQPQPALDLDVGSIDLAALNALETKEETPVAEESLDVTGLDLGSLDVGGLDVNNLNLEPPAPVEAETKKAEEEVFVFPQKKGKKAKGTFRPSAMDLFSAPAAAEETGEAKTEPTNYVLEKTKGGLTFTYAVSEDMNIKGLKKAKKVMTHGKGKARYEMQDANICVFPYTNEESGLFCVFDGHAGKACAIKCTEYFPSIFKNMLKADFDDCKAEFVDAYEILDKKLLQYEDEGATSTTLFTWVKDNHRYIQCANAGDSSAFLCRDGKAVPLSVDHKVTTKSERERVEALGIELGERATRIPGGLAVSRAIGDHFLKSQLTGLIGVPDVTEPIQLTEDDSHIIVASDALWDMISGQEACDMMESKSEVEVLTKRLLDVARKSTDNATVIVIKLE